jgi:hypothetical protein
LAFARLVSSPPTLVKCALASTKARGKAGWDPGSMTHQRSGRCKLIVNELASQVLAKPEPEL